MCLENIGLAHIMCLFYKILTSERHGLSNGFDCDWTRKHADLSEYYTKKNKKLFNFTHL